MKTVKMSAAIPEQTCPACGGAFTVSAANRKRKVQCPQCRAVVSLPAPVELDGTQASEDGRNLPAAPEWMARCEMLQARIEALEQQVEALLSESRTSPSRIPEGLADIGGVVREQRRARRPVESREDFPAETPEAKEEPRLGIERVFQPPTPEIGLVCIAGDGAARKVAEALSEVLARSGWKVRGVTEDKSLPPDCSGLTLSAASSLPLERGTSTLNALRQAGYAVTFQLDPGRDSRETILIVGAGAGLDSGTGAKS